MLYKILIGELLNVIVKCDFCFFKTGIVCLPPFKGVPNSKAYPKKICGCVSGHDCPILKNPRVPEHIGFQKKDTRKEFLDARSPNVLFCCV